jgi:hypothetical protein
LVFEKNANFCRKFAKIAENCDHNIWPLHLAQAAWYSSIVSVCHRGDFELWIERSNPAREWGGRF